MRVKPLVVSLLFLLLGVLLLLLHVIHILFYRPALPSAFDFVSFQRQMLSSKTTPTPTPSLREEFGSLLLCDLPRTWYYCGNNPSCLEESCAHHDETNLTDASVVHFRGMHLAPLSYMNQSHSRREFLKDILLRMERHFSFKPSKILLLTFNSGFSFLFGNWLCSLQHRGVNVTRVQQHTLVLARDHEAREFATQLGFFAPTMKELSQLQTWMGNLNRAIRHKAAPVFGQGQHSMINLLVKFGMPLDLLQLGYSAVFVQDVDFVWFRDPLEEMERRCAVAQCDGIFIAEGRDFWNQRTKYTPYGSKASVELLNRHSEDTTSRRGHRSGVVIPEANTGLFMLPNNARVVHFLEILLQGVFLQQWKRRDQMYFNTVMYHDHFSDMKWELLPMNSFVPGKRLHNKTLMAHPLDEDHVYVLHVSDTGNFELKIKRLHDIHEWHFQQETCPLPVTLCRNSKHCFDSLATCLTCQ